MPFEAEHTLHTRAPASAIWALWADPGRWGEIDSRIERAEAEGESETLEPGAKVRVKMRKGGTSVYDVAAVEPGSKLVTETRFPGARFGHERLVEPDGDGASITHRLYLEGSTWVLWALMLGRKRMRKSVELFGEREREIAEPEAPRKPRKKRRSGRG